MYHAFIEKAMKVHRGKYDYSLVNYKNARTKVSIICSEHGVFEQVPYSHLIGLGCRKCGNMKKSRDKTHTNEWFIQKSTEKHGNSFDYSCSVYTGADNHINIICKTHGQFQTTPYNHLNGDGGCKMCQYEKSSKRYMDTTETFIEKATKIHGDNYGYSKVDYAGNRVPIIITCEKHGDFTQVPADHISGCGCPQCKIEKISLISSDTTETFIEKATKIHGDKYGYSKVDYVNSSTTVIILCKTHGQFQTTPNQHLSGCGCPYCASKQVHPLNCLSAKHPDLVEEWNHEKNGEMTPDKFLPFSNKKVWWICKFNRSHIWESSISNRTNNGRGCPKCCKYFSKMQIEWLKYIEETEKIKIRHALCDDGEFYIPDTRYRADGYCQETNTIYEFNGSIWHGDPRDDKYDADKLIYGRTMKERYDYTQRKKQRIVELGYKFVEMWEYDWKRLIEAVIKIQRIWRKLCSGSVARGCGFRLKYLIH